MRTTAHIGIAAASALALALAAAACGDRTNPALAGATPGIPSRPMVRTLKLQAAYDDTNLYLRVRFPSSAPGLKQNYFHRTGDAWVTEGGDFRDFAAALAGDDQRGDVGTLSAISEDMVSVAISDRATATKVRDFDKYGCFLACHEHGTQMPNWREGDPEESMAFWPGFGGFADVWQWRANRTGLAGYADDLSLSVSGMVEDPGAPAWTDLELDAGGNPPLVFDPAQAGSAARTWASVLATDGAVAFDDGTLALMPDAIPLSSAMTAGYVPAEDDAVPAQLHGTPSGSRADVKAEAVQDAGGWDVTFTRRLVTTDATHDVKFADGKAYDIALSFHTDDAAGRDHYVTLPIALGLGTSGDLVAVKTAGAPAFSDETTYPVKQVEAVLPGVTTFEFLVGAVVTREGEPRTWDVQHGGRAEVAGSERRCNECHKVSVTDPRPSYRDAGPLQMLVLRRGGVYGPTPFFEKEPQP